MVSRASHIVDEYKHLSANLKGANSLRSLDSLNHSTCSLQHYYDESKSITYNNLCRSIDPKHSVSCSRIHSVASLEVWHLILGNRSLQLESQHPYTMRFDSSPLIKASYSAQEYRARYSGIQKSEGYDFSIRDERRQPRNSCLPQFRKAAGWRRGAIINTVLVSTISPALFITQLLYWVQSGSPFGYQVMFSGSCNSAVGRVSTALHLLINILASLILAASNFFMQVISSPTRSEIDHAHLRGNWLDIGMPNPRNVSKVSPRKACAWILFFLSSVPIHVLFNAVIFSTDHRESEFQGYVVDESLLTGGETYLPGASLSFSIDSTVIPPSLTAD